MKHISFATLLLLLFMINTSVVVSQTILDKNNLSTVDVDKLSNLEISKIQQEIDKSGLGIDALEQIALQKGMKSSEFRKLTQRLNTVGVKTEGQDSKNRPSDENLTALKATNVKSKDTKSLVFGSQLFDNPTLNFEPNLQLATPINYILGPGDELQLSIYGVQEYNGSLTVSNEGFIAVPSAGKISVSGITIEAATDKIENALSRIYSTLRSGQSELSLSLSRIRTIQVTIIGSKQPGNYSVSSFSTVYNALFLGGGPSENGSYRKIELLRNNQVIRTIDLYKFLIDGDQSDNLGLKDNDVIRIPTYNARVEILGEVKRPGIFEVINNERFSDILKYASGFTDEAYTASVNVLRKSNRELEVYDLPEENFNSYIPVSGEEFTVTKILERFSNRITIKGAVFRPDMYSYTPGLKILDLITKAEGLTEDAYTERVRVLRVGSDLKLEILNVDLKKALDGDLTENVVLEREDIVTVYSLLDFEEEFKVTIGGEVKSPGVYNYYPGFTLNDLLLQAGGLADAASKRVEIARMIVSDEFKGGLEKSQIVNIEIDPENNEQAENFILRPFDAVNIRRMPVYSKPDIIKVTGAVLYPGDYALATKNERIYDVIKRVGGLSIIADTKGVKIKRPIKQSQIEQIESINLNLSDADSIQNNLEKKYKKEVKFTTIPVNWDDIIKNPESNTNIRLVAGDVIEVVAFSEGVKVAGNVLLTSEIPYQKGKSFRYYIDAVGGTDAKGWKKKSYVIYPNGKASVTKSFLFFKNYPKVLPGSQIIVPEKPERNFDSTAIASFAGILVSLAGVVIALLR